MKKNDGKIVISRIFDSKEEIYKILSQLQHSIDNYGVVTVEDYKPIIGETSSMEDYRIGWYNIDDVRIDYARSQVEHCSYRYKYKYKLILPRTRVIK